MLKATLLACVVLSLGLVVVVADEGGEDVTQSGPGSDAEETGTEAAVKPEGKKAATDSLWPDEIPLSHEAHNKLDLLGFFGGIDYQGQYDKINNYLVEATDSTDFEVNMKLAREQLQRKQAGKLNMIKKKASVKALELFTALANIDGKCDYQSYAILWRNDQATGGEAHKPSAKMSDTPRRIITLLHDVSMKHANDCRDTYPENYRQIRKKADPKTLRIVETFMKPIIEYRQETAKNLVAVNPKKDISESASGVLAGIKTISGKRIGLLAYDVIKAFSKDDKDKVYLRKVEDEKKGEPFVHTQKVKKLVNKYLVEPCKYYMQTFGPDVYIPAMYESTMLKAADRYDSLSGEQLDGFMYGWIRYRLCESLVNKDQEQLTKDVIMTVYLLPTKG